MSPASLTTSEDSAGSPEKAIDWRLLLRQYWAMTTLTMRRYRQTHHIWVIGGLAAIPVSVCFLMLVLNLVQQPGFLPAAFANGSYLNDIRRTAQAAFTGGVLHFALIFLALSFGNSMFREEIDNQTFHYFMLARTPRWMFVVGKLSGFYLLASCTFVAALIVMKALLAFQLGPVGMFHFLFSKEVVKDLSGEIAVVLIALAVYSSLFMVFGMFFRNVLYGLFLYGWELGSNMMPEAIRNFSVVYHLKGILPYQGTDRPTFVGVLAEGPGALQISLVLTGVFVVCLGIALFVATRKQCLYGTD